MQQYPSSHVFEVSVTSPLTEHDREALVRTDQIEAYRMVLPTGQCSPERTVATDELVYCVAGCIAVESQDGECELSAGKMIYVPKDKPHEFRGVQDSVLLIVRASTREPCDSEQGGQESAGPIREQVPLTKGRAKTDAVKKDSVKKDAVEQASEDSFPASDPPGRSPITSP